VAAPPCWIEAVSSHAPKLATYADLLTLPDDVLAEILSGQIVTSPAPLPKHSKVQRSLGHFIGGPYDDDHGHGGPGRWWIFVEVDVQLGRHDIVRPDLAGWRRERLPDPGNRRPIDVVPDWVCEVLSPSTASRDRLVKRQLYAESAVRHYWIVDVDARILEVFEFVEGRWALVGAYGDDATARVPSFMEVELPVGRLFLPRSDRDADI
jgi:Uma2 family endonuclease